MFHETSRAEARSQGEEQLLKDYTADIDALASSSPLLLAAVRVQEANLPPEVVGDYVEGYIDHFYRKLPNHAPTG